MATIKFQRSPWAQNKVNLGASPEEHPDPIIAILEKEALPVKKIDPEIVSIKPKKELLPSSFASWDKEYSRLRPAVRVEGSWDDFRTWSKGILLLWIEERTEWVMIYYNKWIEDVFVDENFCGPFALDDICLRKLLYAYAVPETIIQLKTVRYMSPDKLEDFPRESIR
jgi:hypothetical protein